MRNALLASLVVATATLGLGGQDHPNFSGVWSVVPSLSVWSDEGRSVNITVFGELFTAEQTQDVLSIAIANEGGFKWIYRVDGAVTRNVPRGPEGPQETSSITVWRGSTLVITTTAVVNRDGAKQERETTRRVTFNKDGTLLVEAPWGRNGAMIGSVYSRVRHRRRPKSVSQRRRACRSNSRCSRAQQRQRFAGPAPSKRRRSASSTSDAYIRRTPCQIQLVDWLRPPCLPLRLWPVLRWPILKFRSGPCPSTRWSFLATIWVFA